MTNDDDSTAVKKGFAEAGGDIGQVIPLARKYGASEPTLQDLEKRIRDVRAQFTALSEADRELTESKNAHLVGVIDRLLAEPESLESQLPGLVHQLAQEGFLTKGVASQISFERLNEVGKGDAHLGLLIYRGSLLSSNYVARQVKEAKGDTAPRA